jgi:hypothetical protein
MALRGTAGQGNTTASTTCVVTVSGIGIQSGDIVLLVSDLGGDAGVNTATYPSGFIAVPGLSGIVINTSTALSIAYKVATGSEPSTYTVTSSSGSGADFISVQCRVYSGRNTASPFTAVSSTPTVNSAINNIPPPLTTAITGLTAAASDDIVLFVATDNSGASGANGLGVTAPSGFSNVVSTLGGVTFSPLIVGCDEVNSAGGSTGTLNPIITAATASNISYAGYVLSLSSSGSSNTAPIAWIT